MPVVTLQTPLQRLEAAELASWFDEAKVCIGLAPSTWLDMPARAVWVERASDKLVYEWLRHWNDPQPEPLHFYRWDCDRDEALELLEGSTPAAMAEKVASTLAWWERVTARRAELTALTPAQRAVLKEVEELTRGDEARSNSNKFVETKTSRKRDRNRAADAKIEALKSADLESAGRML